MTLGSTPTPAEIVSELRESFPYTFPDARTRWLAEVGSSDPITIPTDFANKSAIKLVDSITLGSGTSFSPTATFGAAFTGRIILCCVGTYNTGNVDMDITGFSIGGITAEAIGQARSFQAAGSVSAAMGSAAASGTSGTIGISLGGAISAGRLHVFSCANLGGFNSNGAAANSTGTSQNTVDVPDNGIFFMVAAKANTNGITLTGSTERIDEQMGSGGRLAIGWNNGLSLESNRTASFTSTGTAACALRVAGFGS